MKAFIIATWFAFTLGQGKLPTTSGGTGPYKSHYFAEPTLPDHTFYQPINISGLKVPVVVWGNGACAYEGLGFQAFLGQVASFGHLMISAGNPGDKRANQQETAAMMKQSIDWVTANAGKGNYTHVDGSRIAVWGQSCGGTEALAQIGDARISNYGLFDSGGLFDNGAAAAKLDKPVFYLAGGIQDLAWPIVRHILHCHIMKGHADKAQAQRDYKLIRAGVPAFLGSNGGVHINTFVDPDAGKMALVAAKFGQWLLRGDASMKDYFTGMGVMTDGGFTNVTFKDLDKVKVTPIQ